MHSLLQYSGMISKCFIAIRTKPLALNAHDSHAHAYSTGSTVKLKVSKPSLSHAIMLPHSAMMSLSVRAGHSSRSFPIFTE